MTSLRKFVVYLKSFRYVLVIFMNGLNSLSIVPMREARIEPDDDGVRAAVFVFIISSYNSA